MNIEATKLELMQLLLQTQKESLLAKIKQIFEEDTTDWWDELSEEEIQSIKKGIEDADNGKLIEHEEVMKRIFQSNNR